VRWWRDGQGEGGWWGVDCGGAEGGHVGFGIDGGVVGVLVNCPP
jgi:hypothetical protein